ncbi:MAG: L-rhamnose mutarotase [Geminicoccaceae bacterium]|nr:L-rhamnose mutarotase [Geminicoccaceae bacterium]
MEKIGFKMRLHPGMAEEYEKRHDAIWPELAALLKDAGISDYSIFLDHETHTLFATLRRPLNHRMDALAENEVMRRWWAHMADIMDTNEDGSPVVTFLTPVFHLP